MFSPCNSPSYHKAGGAVGSRIGLVDSSPEGGDTYRAVVVGAYTVVKVRLFNLSLELAA